MTTRSLAAVAALALGLQGSPALAGVVTDGHLHLVRVQQPVWIDHIYPYRDYYWRHRRGWRHEREWGDYVTEGTRTEVYITQGPFRISEDEFLRIIDEGGQSPDLLERIHDRQAAAGINGTLALVGWTGAITGAALAGDGVGLTSLKIGSTAMVFNASAVAAIAMGVVGLFYTFAYFDDTAARGAPFFEDFSPSEAQRAIDAYNRHYDETHGSARL